MRLPACLAVVLALSSLTPRASEACIAIGHTGVLPVAGEEALIVWDEASHTEHFIRHAHFDGIDSDFGFVVPTPTQPTLTEVDDDVFSRLFRLYRRPERAADGLRGRGVGSLSTSGAALEEESVTVVAEAEVAGLTSTVLQATSATALDAWLAEHHYASGPELTAYLTPYVAAGWYLTAFRVQPESTARSVAMRAVRMSFTTDRPFFPYSEPQVEGRRPRPFRVSVVASTRMSALEGTDAWNGRVGFARRTPRLHRVIGDVVPEGAMEARPWITTFDERRSLRGTSDLFFVPSDRSRGVASTIDRPIVSLRRRAR